MISQGPIFQVHARLAEIMSLGQTPYGERRIINILGGWVEGPRLKGAILPGGADWQIIRTDGVADIRARYTIEAEGGSRILVNSEGLRHGPPEVMERLARGEPVDAGATIFARSCASRRARRNCTGSTASWRSRRVCASRMRCGSTYTR